jgi:glycosyltransferase involved in cell wall biosynthesis
VQSNPLVSILINNYNYGRFLAEAIDSALSQTYSNIEVIVVDDGSSDNSHEIIKSYGDKIIPILKENGGQASAFNTGFAASQGEIICFLDSDDLFLPEKVAEVVQVFEKHQNIGWCFHDLEFLSKNPDSLVQVKTTGSSGVYDFRDCFKQGILNGKIPQFNVATSGLCFRSLHLKQILPMPEVIRITSDDYIKFTAFGLVPGFVLLKKLGLQRIHDNNAYTLKNDDKKRQTEARIQVLTAYWMRKNFSDFSIFSNNILTLGLARHWLNGSKDLETQKLINTYLGAATTLEKINIYARAFYYRLKP